MNRFQSSPLFAKLCVAAIIVGSILLSIGGYFLPVPNGAEHLAAGESHESYRPLIAAFFFLSGLTLGTAIFLACLRGFKSGFKRSYYVICIGFFCLGFGTFAYITSQLYLVHAYAAGPRLISGAIYLLGALFMYVGVRRFALLLQIKTFWASWPSYLAVCIVAGTIAFILPVFPNLTMFDPFITRIFHANSAVEAVSYFAVANLIWQLRHQASPAYGRALLAFWLTTAPFAVQHLLFIASDYAARTPLVLTTLGIDAFTHIPLLITGYAFYRLSQTDITTVHAGSTVDVIVYTASLASRPSEINTILDPMRQITARQSIGTKITPQDEHALQSVYLHLEQYLTTKEPLRALTRESLRLMLTEKFGYVPVTS